MEDQNELSHTSLRAIQNYIAGKKILKGTAYRKLLSELDTCLHYLDNYALFQTGEGTMQTVYERRKKQYESLRDQFVKTRDYYDNLTDWKKEFHRVGTNIF